jgi:hypothetical protein
MLLIRYAYAAAESSQRTSEGRGSLDATHATHTLRKLLIRYACAAAESSQRTSGSLDAAELRQKLMVREAEVKALSVI